MLIRDYELRRASLCLPVASALVVAAAIGLLELLGCGGGAGVNSTPQSDYPETHYLVAVGTSTESMADAEARARQGVAAQIRSSLESRIDTRIDSEIRDGAETYSASTQQWLSQATTFSHAELIKVDLESRRQKNGLYEVVAYLQRRESSQVLRHDYDTAVAALARHAAAVDAVPSGDLPGFAAAYTEARENWTALHQRAMELWAVTGQPPAGFRQEQARWDAVESRRFAALEGVRVAFDLLEVSPAGDKLDDVFLRQQFIEALTDLGLTVRGDDCESGDYLVEVQPRLHYQGVIGVVCRLDFAGRLVECASGDYWDLHLQDERFVGDGANTYAARKGAEAAVTAEALTPLLVLALDESLPVN